MDYKEDLIKEIQKRIKGEVSVDEEVLEFHSRDTSIFKRRPELVVFPHTIEDIQELVLIVNEFKSKIENLSITARSGGTCMSGGTITDSIALDMKYFDKLKKFSKEEMSAIVEPGLYYRDFEKVADQNDVVYPSYPASKTICAWGGIINNNSGGEKSLNYGKTQNHVLEINMILRDGKLHNFKKLSQEELNKKMKGNDFEAEIYKKTFDLFSKNDDLIKKSKPNVSKNSSGYNIWNVWNKEEKTFNLSQVFIGAQGTFGVMTDAKVKFINKKKYEGMLVVFMDSFDNLPQIINDVLKYKPESFESFDNYTFKLALKFFFAFSKLLGSNVFKMPIEFFPEFMLVLRNGMPKLILLVEFNEDDKDLIDKNIENLKNDLKKYKNLYMRQSKTDKDIEKYFAIRRESFNLLRQRIKNLKSAAFIDDIIVRPENLPDFLPKIYEILDAEKLLYTVAGHMGDGNFHIIPLMDLRKKEERDKIFRIADKVYDLVLSYKGVITAEHNDGLIRSPYLLQEYGEDIYNIFSQLKDIFDPDRIFNPDKKIGVTKEFANSLISED
jgi:FAD/FMN-containing dehydrogenase